MRYLLNEIHSTEGAYVRFLEIIVNNFKAPLQCGVISDGDSKLIFGNCDIILEIHSIFKRDLDSIFSNYSLSSEDNELSIVVSGICKGLHNLTDLTQIYSEYAVNFGQAIDHFSRLCNLDYNNINQKLSNIYKELGVGTTLESYLIMPIQRIPRYRLLLENLSKLWQKSRKSDPKNDPLNLIGETIETTIQKLDQAAYRVNEHLHDCQMLLEMLDIEKRLMFYEKKLTTPGRKLLKIGDLVKICRKGDCNLKFLLFNDILMYCRAINKEESVLIFRRELKIIETEFVDFGDSLIKVANVEKSFLLKTKSDREKRDWISAFCEAKKAISIKLERSCPAPTWIPNSKSPVCMICKINFSWLTWKRRHHCRLCGWLICGSCSRKEIYIMGRETPQRICDHCCEPMVCADAAKNEPPETILFSSSSFE